MLGHSDRCYHYRCKRISLPGNASVHHHVEYLCLTPLSFGITYAGLALPSRAHRLLQYNYDKLVTLPLFGFVDLREFYDYRVAQRLLLEHAPRLPLEHAPRLPLEHAPRLPLQHQQVQQRPQPHYDLAQHDHKPHQENPLWSKRRLQDPKVRIMNLIFSILSHKSSSQQVWCC
jgi:hypothetical protein